MTAVHSMMLTPEHVQIIAGLARGRTSLEAAADLGLPERTVHARIRQAAQRVGLRGGPQPMLVDYAYRHGYLEDLMPEPRPAARLSPRQQQVLQALAQGLSVDQTAKMMGISSHTAREHRVCLYAALRARTRAHAVALGWQAGILGDPVSHPSAVCRQSAERWRDSDLPG